MNYEKLDYKGILNTVNSCISFDISKNSTGVIVWDKNNQKLDTYTITIKSTKLEDVRKEFCADIFELFKESTFDFVAIEAPIMGNNFDTVTKLVSLNYIIDIFMEQNLIPISPIIRIDNNKWKKYLRILSGLERVPRTPKEEIRTCLQKLGYNEDVEQDVWDALGMALGVIGCKYFFSENTENKTRKLHSELSKGYELKIFADYDDAFEHIDTLKAAIKERTVYELEIPDSKPSSLTKEFKKLVEDIGDEHIFLISMKVEALGVLCLSHNFDFENIKEQICLLAYRKSK